VPVLLYAATRERAPDGLLTRTLTAAAVAAPAP
jgi:hypothetical protein